MVITKFGNTAVLAEVFSTGLDLVIGGKFI